MITILEMYEQRAYKGDVGIEIEIEGTKFAPPPKGWHSDYDGSLNNGMEYITSGGVKEKDIASTISTLDKSFKNHGTVRKPSVRCGVHVHVNVQDMSHTQVVTFATLYYVLENILLDFCGVNREGNLFCLSGTDGHGVFDTLRQAANEGNFYCTNTDNIRYAALNWKPVTSYGSLEFRALATPKTFTKVALWAKILLQLRKASLKYKNPVDIMVEFSGSDPQDFIATHLGPYAGRFNIDYKSRKASSMLRDGMYNAQDLAYMANWVEFEECVLHEYADVKHPQYHPALLIMPEEDEDDLDEFDDELDL